MLKKLYLMTVLLGQVIIELLVIMAYAQKTILDDSTFGPGHN